MWRSAIALLAFLSVSIPLAAQKPRHPTAAETRAEFQAICEQLRRSDNVYFGDAPAREVEKVLQEEGLPPETRVKGLATLARDHLRQGRNEEAVATYRDSLGLAQKHRVDPQLQWALLAELGLAYLRLGEVTNCIGHHSPRMCIYPIGEGGRHPEPAAARKAMDFFLRFLEIGHNPSVHWLLTIAAMTAGEYPDGLPEHLRLPTASLRSEGDVGWFPDVAAKAGLDIHDNSGGGVMDDFDGDGLLDVLTSSVEPCTPLRLYLNDGEGGFVSRAREAGLDGQLGGFNLVHGDYDNDGDLDFFVARGGWMGDSGRIRSSLMNNLGTGPGGIPTFVDVTAAAGLAAPAYPNQTAAWADYDNDGDLDLYVGNEGVHPEHDCCFPSQLFRNDGPGSDGVVTFTDVAEAAGVTNRRYAKGVTWGDIDNDGDEDLYVSNLGRNRLYRNDGPGPGGAVTFTDVAPALGMIHPEPRSFPTWFFDYDNDGDLDLFVGQYHGTPAHFARPLLGKPQPGLNSRLYRNETTPGGELAFREVSLEVGLAAPALPMGANFGDLDNDGFEDFYLGTGDPRYEALMPNLMFRNVGGERFEDVTFSGGFGHLQKGHGVAFGDVDNDGDQDVFEQMGGAYPGDAYPSVLFENPGHGKRWLTLRLAGRRSNRSGIGSRIEVEIETPSGPRSIHRRVGSGGSFGGSPLRQEIGLGDATAVRRLEVYWPAGGTRQTFRGVAMDTAYELREGAAELSVLALEPIVLGGRRPAPRHRHTPAAVESPRAGVLPEAGDSKISIQISGRSAPAPSNRALTSPPGRP